MPSVSFLSEHIPCTPTARLPALASRLTSSLRMLLAAAVLATMTAIVPATAQAGPSILAKPSGDLLDCIGEDSSKAIAACTRMIALKTAHGSELALLYAMRATASFGADRFDDAIVDADAAIRHDASLELAYAILGISRYEKGDYDRAIASLTEGLRLKPSDSMYYEQRGRAWLAKGDLAHAMADFDTRIARAPHEASAFMGRARVWKKMGDCAQAMTDFDTAIGLDPSVSQGTARDNFC